MLNCPRRPTTLSPSMPRRSSIPFLAVAALVFFAYSSGASVAGAQNRVEAPHKGAIGLTLLGAELGLAIPCAFGYDETWSLITFPIVGAAGGAVAGVYLDRAGSPAASVSALVVGLAFTIPSVMITVSATRYSTRDLEQDSRTALMNRRILEGSGFLRSYRGQFRLGMPGIDVTPIRRLEDTHLVTAGAEFRFTLVSGAF